ncbi:MAG: hypothetical protein IPM79_12605 [Polyangiaceae bacterium]|nr:hypothetical protein [Polyangiaceae bacterium]
MATTSCDAGISSGIDYPDVSNVDLEGNLVTPEGDEKASVSLGKFKFAPETCTGVDLSMVKDDLDQEDLTRFFAAHNINARAKRARDDLWWYEIENQEDDGDRNVLRLRVAVLKDRYAASKDLHDALLQHGPGWWGVRRGNIAVLAPKASLSTALRFALKHKLPCWGMFTYAGVDDAYVVAGGYTEF